MIANFNELVKSIAKELEREDLSYKIPEWIQLAEMSLSRIIGMKDGEQFIQSTLVVDQAYIDVPVGFRRPIGIEIQTDPLRTLTLVDMTKRTDVLQNDLTGLPRTITWIGRRGYLAPVPKTAEIYHLFYYGKPAPLGPDNQTNDLLEIGGDVLKYEALKYSAPFLFDDERLITWEAILTPARASLKREYWDAMLGGGILRQRQDFAPGDSHDVSAVSNG